MKEFNYFTFPVGAMLDLTQTTIIKGTTLFSWYNGAFTENFVAQELVATGQNNLYYWTSESTAEVDFVLPFKENIFPLEVKAGLITKSKSLQIYYSKYNPPILSRTSQLNFNRAGKYYDYPLYAIFLFPKIYLLEEEGRCNSYSGLHSIIPRFQK